MELQTGYARHTLSECNLNASASTCRAVVSPYYHWWFTCAGTCTFKLFIFIPEVPLHFPPCHCQEKFRGTQTSAEARDKSSKARTGDELPGVVIRIFQGFLLSREYMQRGQVEFIFAPASARRPRNHGWLSSTREMCHIVYSWSPPWPVVFNQVYFNFL
jgi:hypothetical protein